MLSFHLDMYLALRLVVNKCISDPEYLVTLGS